MTHTPRSSFIQRRTRGKSVSTTKEKSRFCARGLSAVLGAGLVLSLAACGGLTSEPTYKDKVKSEEYRYGSLASDEGGISVLGGPDKEKDAGGLTVNAYLWRASLDTVSFMPIASADPFGGVILTDWYAKPETPTERLKLTVFILSRDLRADGVRVKAFRQTQDKKGNWRDADIAPTTASALEDSILTRARQMRMAQKDKP